MSPTTGEMGSCLPDCFPGSNPVARLPGLLPPSLAGDCEAPCLSAAGGRPSELRSTSMHDREAAFRASDTLRLS